MSWPDCIKTLPSKVLSGETEWEIKGTGLSSPKVPATIPSPIRMATAIAEGVATARG